MDEKHTIDSSMHISVPHKLKSNNTFLNNMYLMGLQEVLDASIENER